MTHCSTDIHEMISLFHKHSQNDLIVPQTSTEWSHCSADWSHSFSDIHRMISLFHKHPQNDPLFHRNPQTDFIFSWTSTGVIVPQTCSCLEFLVFISCLSEKFQRSQVLQMFHRALRHCLFSFKPFFIIIQCCRRRWVCHLALKLHWCDDLWMIEYLDRKHSFHPTVVIIWEILWMNRFTLKACQYFTDTSFFLSRIVNEDQSLCRKH